MRFIVDESTGFGIARFLQSEGHNKERREILAAFAESGRAYDVRT